MYLSLYRKYRPQTFDDVIGQEHITTTLKNQIKLNKIPHAYLFTGSRGTGKTSTAKIFAKAINCLSPKDGSPCGECEVCKALSSANIDVLEMDAASNNGVDDIRELIEKVKYPPVYGKYKVFIIDEVHMFSTSAFNAFLKTLEEPSENVVFILATTEVHKVPVTILSRCLRFDFKLVSIDDLSALLKKILDNEKIKYEDSAINIIARAGEGSVRDMLSVADRCISYSGEMLSSQKVMSVLGILERDTITNMADKILNKQIGEALVLANNVISSGKSPLAFSNDIISYFRDLLLIYTMGDESRKIVITRDEDYQKMKLHATQKNYESIIRAIESFSMVEQELRFSSLPRLVLETAIIRCINNISLEDRLKEVENKLEANNFPSGRPIK